MNWYNYSKQQKTYVNTPQELRTAYVSGVIHHLSKTPTFEYSSIHDQWPKAMRFPDGITSLQEYEECLHFLRGLGEQIIYRGEHRYYEKHVAPSCFRFGDDWPTINEKSNLTKAELTEVRKMQLRKF